MVILKRIDSNQLLRIQRYSMAIGTYIVVIFATLLTTQLGLGELTRAQWAVFIGLGTLINIFLFLVFYKGINLRFSDSSLTREQIIFSALWGMVPMYSLPDARPIVLLFYIPAFSFGLLRLTRRQYFTTTSFVMGAYALLLVLEYYYTRPGFNIQYELFLFTLFGILLTWFAFFGGFVHTIRQNLKIQNRKTQQAYKEIETEVEERRLAQIEKDKLILELQDALHEVKTLSGLLPICASCKKIRDDKGYWNKIESYIRTHSNAEFTHSICPDCSQELYPSYTSNKKTD